MILPYKYYLRKQDGKQRYNGDLTAILKATLFANRLFLRDAENLWMMDTKRV